MVMRLLKLLILIVVILLAWQFIAPHLRQSSPSRAPVAEQEDSGEPGSATCVQVASETNDAVVSALRDISWPKVNRARWDSVRPDLEQQVGAAQATCSCTEPACETAAEMLQEIESLISAADDAISGGMTGMFNPATTEEHIQALLTKARAQAAGGF
jgi:hypothetical protein